MDSYEAAAEALSALLETSLAGVMEEQLSLAVQWARRQNDQAAALTRELLEEEEKLTALFPRQYDQYAEACRQAWDSRLRLQWLAGLRGALNPAARPEPEPAPAENLPLPEEFFPGLSADQARALLERRRKEERLFQVQAPYFRQTGRQVGRLIAGLT